MHLSILGPTTPLRAVTGNCGWIFHLLDHKNCPIGGAFDFGHLHIKLYARILNFVAHLNQLDRAVKVKLESALICTKIYISVMSLRKSIRNCK